MRPIIYIAIGIIGVCLLGLLFIGTFTNETPETFKIPEGYKIICYPDKSYGWIDETGFRDIHLYNSKNSAIEAAHGYSEYKKIPIDTPSRKFKTWEDCTKPLTIIKSDSFWESPDDIPLVLFEPVPTTVALHFGNRYMVTRTGYDKYNHDAIILSEKEYEEYKKKMSEPPPAIVESGWKPTNTVTIQAGERWWEVNNIDTGIGSIYEEMNKDLVVIVNGELVIQFVYSDKEIIGMDGRIIGYLNDEEVELLEKFWE